MDSKTALLIVAVQLAALAVLFQRYGVTYLGLGCGFEDQTELLIHSERVVTPKAVIDATLHVRDGKILDVIPAQQIAKLASLQHLKLVDYCRNVISPGLIDAHVHFNEPGIDQREGIKAGTRSAVAGGVTTVAEMPMPCSPITDSCPRFKSKIFRFKREAFSHIGGWGGITPENCGNEAALTCMVKETAAFGFHSTLAEDASNLPPVNATHLRMALPIVKRLGVAYSIQPQLPLQLGAPWDVEQEHSAVEMVLDLLRELDAQPMKPGFRVHFIHVISVVSVERVQEAKKAGMPVSVEMAPHYLHFSHQQAEGNPLLKSFPPIGSEANRQALWQAVRRGEIDLIASDHAPAMPNEKSASDRDSMIGVTGTQYLLPVVWSGLSSNGAPDFALLMMTDLLSVHPAELLNLGDSKGAIAEGFDADFVVWDPEGVADTSRKGCRMTHPQLCPYLDASLRGAVRATWLNGNLISDSERGQAWSSCRKILGLGEWARGVVLWFLPFSYDEP